MNPPHILIIDDDDLMCGVLAELLQLEGYRVSLAHDGEEGLRQLASERPDLILLDLLMPRMDGVRFLRRLAEDHPGRPPIIVLSASAAGSVLEGIEQPLVRHILRKPVRPPELLEAVKAALGPGAG